MAHRSDRWYIENTRNTARFFTEQRQVAWVALVFTALWGLFGYFGMPQRKDPDIPIRAAMALCYWPGVATEKVERLVTQRIEETIAENVHVEKIESTTRVGMCFAVVSLDEAAQNVALEFDDIKLKLDGIRDLPDGAGPVIFIKDFGSTAALMLSVASPPTSEVEVAIKSDAVRRAIEKSRAEMPASPGNDRVSIVFCYPPSVSTATVRGTFSAFANRALGDGILLQQRFFEGAGFLGVDATSPYNDSAIASYGQRYIDSYLRSSELHPDVWQPALIRDPADTKSTLLAVAGDKYTYRELDEYTELIRRTLQTVPEVSKIDRVGVLDEQISLVYSQERLAAYDIPPTKLSTVLGARNTPVPGGTLEVGGRNINIAPTGEFTSESEIGGVIVSSSESGVPLYLRDLVDVNRGYKIPPDFLNFYSYKLPDGSWHRARAITLSVQMRPGRKIGEFGAAVDSTLTVLRQRLPEDLLFARTSDQPLQVEENIDLFISSLYEAVLLVVLVSLIGFWEWRSAVLMSLSIPLTLAMTYGMMYMIGIDLQQISIATLIIALGLLVDDPVVAGDAIKRELSAGHSSVISAWLGPTKLATAILYATITNIVAYLPFLLISGDTGKFLHSLPVVMTCSLVASRLVSMTFIPLLGHYLLRAPKKAAAPIHDRRTHGFAGWYYRTGKWAIENRWKVFFASLLFLLLGGVFMSQLKTQFFPKDLSYLSYIDVWLPEDASLTATSKITDEVEAITREVCERFGKEHTEGAPRDVLKSLTTFLGGGGPRFWSSVSPEPKQTNYAQIVIHVYDKHDTHHLLDELQEEFSRRIVGARVSARLLEIGPIVGIPVSIRISGDNAETLLREAEKVKAIYRDIATTDRVQDDWGSQSFVVGFEIDPDRANMAGVSNYDVAVSSLVGVSGQTVGVMREDDKQIPIVTRLRVEERAQLSDLENLYVYSSQSTQRVPLQQISQITHSMQLAKLKRRNQFRTISVSCFPTADVLPSEVLTQAMPKLREFESQLPPGFQMEIGGEYEEQTEGFLELAIVMAISILAIFAALVMQFKNAIKPFLVFAAIPYGMVGALAALWIMGAPFGFMAFLGVASLVGVIVSHVIVLFDFIEEEHEKGAPLIDALLDAGIVRLRPVLITVGATVFALFPLASHGGPLWEPLCYAQIGGLTVATFVTLLMVPVLYAIFVMDLKIVRWERHIPTEEQGVTHD